MTNITARDIVSSVGLVANPEYHKGRGAWSNDLDGETLADIHQKIKMNFGEDAASAFVTMIQNIKLLSVKKFLESLYALEKNSWNFSEAIQTEINEKKENYGSMNTIYEYRISLRDDTTSIKRSFMAYINSSSNKRYLRFESYLRTTSRNHDEWLGDFNDSDDNDDYAEYE